MSDEELMKALGREARSRRSEDPRWEALAAGRLSDAEVAELLEEAAQSEAAAEAYEAYRPLGAEFKARVVERLSGELERGGERASTTAKVVAFPRRPPSRFVPLALAASVLIAVGLVFLLRPDGGPLPDYALRLDGQVTLMRGETPSAETAPFAPGNHFRLVLTPATGVSGDVAARAYVVENGVAQPLAAPAARVAESGSVLIEGEVGTDVELPAGSSGLLVVVGREDSLPDPDELARDLGASGQRKSEDWSAWMIPLRVE